MIIFEYKKIPYLKILISTFILFMIFTRSVIAQEKRAPIYSPDADAQFQIKEAVLSAKKENKNVFIQIGGNWCPWCYMFNDFIHKDQSIDSLVRNNYITIHINYSKENLNKPVLASLGYPQRFGFPLFVILDKDGKEIHIQDSSLLEEGHGYNKEKVTTFFKNWTAEALDPDKYK